VLKHASGIQGIHITVMTFNPLQPELLLFFLIFAHPVYKM